MTDVTDNTPVNIYDQRVREGWRAAKLYAPVKIMTASQYEAQKRREQKLPRNRKKPTACNPDTGG